MISTIAILSSIFLMARVLYKILHAKGKSTDELIEESYKSNSPERRELYDESPIANGSKSFINEFAPRNCLTDIKVKKNGNELKRLVLPPNSYGNFHINYVFDNIDDSILEYAINDLNYFRFIRAQGGHANDGDLLATTLKFDSNEKSMQFLNHLGAELENIDLNKDSNFTSLNPTNIIHNLQLQESINERTIKELWVNFRIDSNLISIRIASLYEVTIDILKIATNIEEYAQILQAERFDPPKYHDNKNCICPKYYSKLFT